MRNQPKETRIRPAHLNAVLSVGLAAFLAAFTASPARAASASAAAASLPEAAKPFAIVELFTSEGCSSCPPADRLLSGMASEAERKGAAVFALSFHVDYWNSLGWADPFSRAEFSERQQRYSRALGSGIYTPQMIVNGKNGFVGSREGLAREAVAAALAKPAETRIVLKPDTVGASAPAAGNGNLRLRYSVRGHGAGDLLNIALVETGLSVPVKRGENRGRTLKHANVVRAFGTVELDAGGDGRAVLKVPAGVRRDRTLLIAYSQKAESLRVTGAVRSAAPWPGS
jgi:hypothetical protein